MARMSVDDMFLRDPRVGILALALGCNKYEARGRLLEVWSICYDRVSEALPEAHIDAASEIRGFASALVKAELAFPLKDGMIRISGVKQRVEYLEAKIRAGRKGGVKSGESRRNTDEAKPKQPRTTPQAQPNPSVSASAPVSAPVPDPPNPPVQEKSPDVRRVTDCFQAYFVSRTRSKPTWDAKTGTHIQQLLKAHGVDEVVRRIGVLDASPEPFPAHPWDFPTFRQHFDRCATEQRKSPGKTGGVSNAVLRLANGDQ